MQKDLKTPVSSAFFTKVTMLCCAISLIILSCGPVKKAGNIANKTVAHKGPFNLQTAMRSGDTTAIREFLAGDWTLERMCRSSFAGLKCDSSIHQNWQLDSLGAISWITEGENTMQGHYRFVPKTAARTRTGKTDTTWVLYLNQQRRGYLIRALTKDSLTLAQYPLIMDNATTYYLRR